MAIPLLIGGALALFGGIAGINAMVDKETAKETIDDAKDRLDGAKKRMEKARITTNDALEDLGRLRITTEASSIARFVEAYSKVKALNYKDLDHRKHRISSSQLKEMSLTSNKAIELTMTGVEALGQGVLAGIGSAGSAVMLATTIGTASTGTAIGTLSGAALTNATLAWLGGGSLAAGGMGVAGGAIALGGLVAGPALAVIGFISAGQAAKELTEAKKKAAEVDIICEQIDSGIALLECIEMRIAEIACTINNVDRLLIRELIQVETWLAERAAKSSKEGFLGKIFKAQDPLAYTNFSAAQQQQFDRMLQFAIALNQLLRIQVLEEDGSLNQETAALLASVEARIEELG